MKRMALLFGLFVVCHFCAAQKDDNLWKPFQAKMEQETFVFQGNGYRIKTQSIEIPVYKSRFKRYLDTGMCRDESYYWSLAESLLDCYSKRDITVSREGNLFVYSYTHKAFKDSIPAIRTAYILPVTDYLLSGISFSRLGAVDTAYQRRLADDIWNNGIPSSVLVPLDKDTIYFLGQKIPNPPVPGEKNEWKHVYHTDLKSFSGSHTKFRTNRGYIDCSWDTFLTDEEAEQAKNTFAINRGYVSANLLYEGKDTVVFRGNEIPADKIVAQQRSHDGRYMVTTTYFVKAEHENLPVLIKLHITMNGDSIGSDMPLPSFISENIFQLKNVSPAVAVIKDSIPAADTLFVAKKNRLPVWTYYDKHTRITGLSLGIGEFGKPRNVTTNGVKLDVIGTSLAYSLFPPFLLAPPSLWIDMDNRWRPAEQSILYKNRFCVTNGLSLSVAGSVQDGHIINGIGFGGLATINYRVNGLSIAGLNNGLIYSNGLQVGGLWATARYSNGVLIGVVAVQGHQVRGVQIGVFNFVKEQISGLQVGLINTAVQSSGLQIGLFNRSKKLKGVQIGLWNKSDRRSLPLFNWGR